MSSADRKARAPADTCLFDMTNAISLSCIFFQYVNEPYNPQLDRGPPPVNAQHNQLFPFRGSRLRGNLSGE
jgi:hypothetical protein